MKFLLDTHTLLWFIRELERLPPHVLERRRCDAAAEQEETEVREGEKSPFPPFPPVQ